MKFLISILTLVFVFACSSVNEVNHLHGENCGHQAVSHGNHVDYIAQGNFWTADGEFHGSVEMVDSEVNRKISSITTHENHDHGPSCGHNSIKHCENPECTSYHYDFNHDGTYHAIHGGHWHNHGKF